MQKDSKNGDTPRFSKRIKIATEEMKKAMAKFAESFGKRNQEAIKNFSIAVNKYLEKQAHSIK